MVTIPLPLPLPRGAHRELPRPPAARLSLGWSCPTTACTDLVTPHPSDPYTLLRRSLAAQEGETLTLTFAAIERLLGSPLPDAAWRRTWWANSLELPQARAWLRAGWQVHWVRRRGSDAAVTFTRTRHQRPHHAGHPAASPAAVLPRWIVRTEG